eukprot:g61578.t1
METSVPLAHPRTKLFTCNLVPPAVPVPDTLASCRNSELFSKSPTVRFLCETQLQLIVSYIAAQGNRGARPLSFTHTKAQPKF